MPARGEEEAWDVVYYKQAEGPLDNGSPQQLRERGLTRPAIAVITGMRKPFMTVFDERDYASVRRLGDDYRAQLPRRIKT